MIKTTKKSKATPSKGTSAIPSAAKSAVIQTSKSLTPTTPIHKANGPNHILLELVNPGAKTVCVAGSFNEWKPERTPLVSKGNGRWVGDLSVKPGRHEYLFVVDGQWLPDPNAKESVANPFGGQNSVLIVSA